MPGTLAHSLESIASHLAAALMMAGLRRSAWRRTHPSARLLDRRANLSPLRRPLLLSRRSHWRSLRKTQSRGSGRLSRRGHPGPSGDASAPPHSSPHGGRRIQSSAAGRYARPWPARQRASPGVAQLGVAARHSITHLQFDVFTGSGSPAAPRPNHHGKSLVRTALRHRRPLRTGLLGLASLVPAAMGPAGRNSRRAAHRVGQLLDG